MSIKRLSSRGESLPLTTETASAPLPLIIFNRLITTPDTNGSNDKDRKEVTFLLCTKKKSYRKPWRFI